MGILDSVIKACEAGDEHIKALLWGPNGTGKSTMCGTAPKPILYAYTERQGLLSFKRMAPGQDVIKINKMNDLRALLKELREGGHGYKSICLDSFTEMQALIADEILARRRIKNAENGRDESAKPSKLTIEDFMFIHDKSKSIVRAFRDLQMHVVLTCLSETVIIGEEDEAQKVVRVMLLGRKLPAQLGQFFNLVGFTYKAALRNGGVGYKVLFEGRTDIDTKGMPGLRCREDPDISYWYNRAIKECDPKDPDAPMIAMVSPGVDVIDEPVEETTEEESEPENKTKKQKSKKQKKTEENNNE